ncbi:glyoxalase [Chryseobacterium shandongense]|uniref:Glyoxalase n=1 Tax=Chryseobacterium shandongense TaxID=1493872 RepID=A0AAD0YC42_9FLAO|nr:VOC family protein [Chryseobacterium shandongense]AZA85498.1 glyoxalase [Chryseobacterium shandongense]AZA97670.1 glyoxalase [Chryseobacterium shandongense]
MDNYLIPPKTRIGHIHLKVSDLQRSIYFYCDLLGFEVMNTFGDSAAFLSAGGYHHHIGLNTWYSKNRSPAPEQAPGLYHTAILYPEQRDLAVALNRLILAEYPITGSSDHGVSQAIYLDDPDGNGVELYWDRPEKEWQFEDGKIVMDNRPLHLEDLLSLL